LNEEIAAYDCFDAALVYEELSPLSELPKDIVTAGCKIPH